MQSTEDFNGLLPLLKKYYHIDGNFYVTLREFSRITRKSPPFISILITKGNGIRKLKTMDIGKVKFIPIEEIVNFPFVRDRRQRKDGTTLIEKYVLVDGSLMIKQEILDLEKIKENEQRENNEFNTISNTI
jgi:hypothetical protein